METLSLGILQLLWMTHSGTAKGQGHQDTNLESGFYYPTDYLLVIAPHPPGPIELRPFLASSDLQFQLNVQSSRYRLFSEEINESQLLKKQRSQEKLRSDSLIHSHAPLGLSITALARLCVIV